MVNLTQCGLDFAAGIKARNQTMLDWRYAGIPLRINKTDDTQITYRGCRELCGTAPDYYSFDEASSAITTWILPIMGILSQGPYESNKAWATLLVIARWMGSPIISLAYILWNIRVLGNIAMMVDMSVGIDEPLMDVARICQVPAETTDPTKEESRTDAFYDMRDALYLLGVMNQYSINRIKREMQKVQDYTAKRAEGLVRIVLFSSRLDLKRDENCPEHPKSLRDARRQLASRFRRSRKRGIVPVFVSTLWFIFALSLSIYTAFSEIGTNSVAHDLALGLLLGWLPVLILCSIVDRNPTDPDGNVDDLNGLVLSVCRSLIDREIFVEYYNKLIALQENEPKEFKVNKHDLLEELLKIRKFCQFLIDEHSHNTSAITTADSTRSTGFDISKAKAWFQRSFGPKQKPERVTFFGNFAGQARERWHYGAAHPILSEIEDVFIGGEWYKPGKRVPGKRNWLSRPDRARLRLVLGNIALRKGLIWWDNRELWQIFAAAIIVYVSCFAAFVLSYNTPTVGLGCRSGGYLIYVTLSTLLLILELLAWRVGWRNLLTRPRSDSSNQDQERAAQASRQPETSGSALPARQQPHAQRSSLPVPRNEDRRPSSTSDKSTKPLLRNEHGRSGPSHECKNNRPPADARPHGKTVRRDSSFQSSRDVSPNSLGSRDLSEEERITGSRPTSSHAASHSQPAGNAELHVQNQLDESDSKEHPNGRYAWFEPLNLRSYFKNLLLIPLEILNASWLVYIVFAQTSGGYRSCECVTSSWELAEKGYLDFTQNNIANTPSLPYYWIPSTVLGTSVLGIGLLYVISEWALQSHMNTSNRVAARNGLRRARWYRKYTIWFRRSREWILDLMRIHALWPILRFVQRVEPLGDMKKTMRWIAKNTEEDPSTPPVQQGSDNTPFAEADGHENESDVQGPASEESPSGQHGIDMPGTPLQRYSPSDRSPVHAAHASCSGGYGTTRSDGLHNQGQPGPNGRYGSHKC